MPDNTKKIKHTQHLWKTYDGQGTVNKNDPNIDICAYSSGDVHNGPVCINCGYGFCHHCHPEEYDSECDVGFYTCEHCSAVVDKNDKFCRMCGSKFNDQGDET